MTPELAPVTLEVAKLDSLSQVGDEELQALQEGGRWQIGNDMIAPQYNRAQGLALFVGVAARKTGPQPPTDGSGGRLRVQQQALAGDGRVRHPPDQVALEACPRAGARAGTTRC